MPSPLFPNFNEFQRQKEAIARWLKAKQQQQARNQTRGGEPMRYGSNSRRSGIGQGNWLWNSILSKLGPLGSIVDSLLRPNGKSLAPNIEKELQAAQELLAAFGYEVGKPDAKPIVGELVKEVAEQVTPKPEPKEAATPVRRSSEEPRQPDEPAADTDAAIRTATGLVEGMIPVTSSNVHSIGFEWSDTDPRNGNLLVRFLGGDSKHRSGPGPLYKYKDVPRSVFDAFKRASSKGGFVWDELRVRGTVSGHQYSYDLEGLGDTDRVPRQATVGKRGRGGESFVKRTLGNRRSSLPDHEIRGGRDLVKDFKKQAKKIRFR